ncbi:MAG: carboxypeptidase-like regulatory domain-containing protein [Acidobacteriota bacterium]
MKSIALKSSFGILFRLFGVFVISAAALTLNVGAQTTTFAQFFERNGTNDFVFTNNTSSATFDTIGGGTPIYLLFSNISDLDPSLATVQSAHLFITTTTTNPATLTGGTITQPLNSVVTIQIIRDTPAPVGSGSATNLLTATFSPSAFSPSMVGSSGGNSATLQATTPDNNVLFTSDFLNFRSTTSRNLSFSFSSASPSFSLGAGGFVQSFLAAGSGTFASNPPPTVFIPTAAPVSVTGRILNPYGAGLQNAIVTVIEANGAVHTAQTSAFGYFSFPAVESGQSVVISVRSKQFQFDPQIATLGDNIADLQFIGH